MAKQLYKSKNSIHNAILLLLFVVGLFILYRYVKNVDTENKMLHTHVLELSEKVHLLNNINTKILKESNEEINVPKQNQVQNQEKLNQEKLNQVELDQGELNEFLVQELNQVFEPYKHQTCTVEDVEDDDDESIKSIDITDMLKKVMGSNCEEDEKEEEEEEDDGELLDLEIDEIVEKVYEEEEEARNSVQEVSTNIVKDDDVEDVEEDDEVVIVPKLSKEKLLKETNDSLREILKSKGLLTKGSKAELVERIIGSVH
jgi:hypothetical protein